MTAALRGAAQESSTFRQQVDASVGKVLASEVAARLVQC